MSESLNTFKLGGSNKIIFGIPINFPDPNVFIFNDSKCTFCFTERKVTVENGAPLVIGKIGNNDKKLSLPFVGSIFGENFLICFRKRYFGLTLDINLEYKDGNKYSAKIFITNLKKIIFNNIRYDVNRTLRILSLYTSSEITDAEIILGCVLCSYLNEYSNPPGSN